MTEQLSGMRMRNLAILFPLAVLLVLAFLSSTLFGLGTVAKWLFVAVVVLIIAIVLVVLRISKVKVYNRLMDVRTELKTREDGGSPGQKNGAQCSSCRKEIAEKRSKRSVEA